MCIYIYICIYICICWFIDLFIYVAVYSIKVFYYLCSSLSLFAYSVSYLFMHWFVFYSFSYYGLVCHLVIDLCVYILFICILYIYIYSGHL